MVGESGRYASLLWGLFLLQGNKLYVVNVIIKQMKNSENFEMYLLWNRCVCLACVSAQCSGDLSDETVVLQVQNNSLIF